MSDQYGLRAHNRRVANPQMVFHTPTYYRVRTVARGVTKFVVNSLWGSLILGFPICVWLAAGWLGHTLTELAK